MATTPTPQQSGVFTTKPQQDAISQPGTKTPAAPETSVNGPAAVQQAPEKADLKVEIVDPVGTAASPETAAPDGSDPSKFPKDGTKLEGLAGGPAGIAAVGGEPVKAEVQDGNPPAYNEEGKHGINEEPTDPSFKRPIQCRVSDMTEGATVYKLGVSHPPYVVESASKGTAVLRSGTGGTVTISNDSEASYFTLDQSRQYAVADGNPNVNGDVKQST